MKDWCPNKNLLATFARIDSYPIFAKQKLLFLGEQTGLSCTAPLGNKCCQAFGMFRILMLNVLELDTFSETTHGKRLKLCPPLIWTSCPSAEGSSSRWRCTASASVWYKRRGVDSGIKPVQTFNWQRNGQTCIYDLVRSCASVSTVLPFDTCY